MLPRFYIAAYDRAQTEVVLDEDTSRHIVQVLRMKTGERLELTDGKGHLLEAAILDGHKKKCVVGIRHAGHDSPREGLVTLAISLLKNVNRFEWLLEKATEIGVSRIVPLICERTEKHQLRVDRMHHILVAAMLQSQQTWLPELIAPTPIGQVIGFAKEPHRFIAHCAEGRRSSLAEAALGGAKTEGRAAGSSSIILIGPEGDFTADEITLALDEGFVPVTLGGTRLRTETAGIVAAAWLCAK